MIKGSLAVTIGTGLGSFMGCASPQPALKNNIHSEVSSRFDFTEIPHGTDQYHHVSPEHNSEILIRWGDPLFPDAPEFAPYAQTANDQERQFGFNNDFIGYLELPSSEGQEARALLCVNHEYPGTRMMFTNMSPDYRSEVNAEHMEIEKAATGCSIVEIRQIKGAWEVNRKSKYNRRINSRSTEFEITGPVAGHKRLRTKADETGKKVIGTLNNCAGGITPWGTYLSCEENFNYHFSGNLTEEFDEYTNYKRYGVPGNYFLWGQFDPRFNIDSEPNEPNRFGWVIEIDPLDPLSIPKKRTALGRFKHEGAENVIAPDGRLVIYMGDDQRFDYLYKFVTEDRVNRENPSANKNILDKGTLFVARFEENGKVIWMPIQHGIGPLTASNGFKSQADVLIETRRAADLLGATPMDRPEDVVPNKQTGKVYVMLTNNSNRSEDDTNSANPRGPNLFGHIIEITEPNADFSSDESTWDFLIKAGDPSRPEVEAQWHRNTTENGWFTSPDNGAIDPSGRLWVSTDQGEKVPLSGTNDGLWAIETDGELKGLSKMFFRCPNGAELCGPAFSNDGESLFLAIQHPGIDEQHPDTNNFDNPSTRWPDFDHKMPPRPAVVVVQRKKGGSVG